MVIQMDKAAVFIDGGYLAKVLEWDFNRVRIDFELFSNELCQNAERLRTYYYTCMPYQSNPPTAEESARYSSMNKFIYNLKKLSRFEVKLGKLSYIGGEYVQKRVDILMAVDIVRMSWDKQIQRAVILTGDSDFVPAVQASKDAGVLTQLFYSNTSCHDELKDACDDRFEITQDLIDAVLLQR